jgi:hypothetical protein
MEEVELHKSKANHQLQFANVEEPWQQLCFD